MQYKKYYDILELDETASEDEIKRAYKKKALMYHPDKYANSPENIIKEKSNKFNELHTAYKKLLELKNTSIENNNIDMFENELNINIDDNISHFFNMCFSNDINIFDIIMSENNILGGILNNSFFNQFHESPILNNNNFNDYKTNIGEYSVYQNNSIFNYENSDISDIYECPISQNNSIFNYKKNVLLNDIISKKEFNIKVKYSLRSFLKRKNKKIKIKEDCFENSFKIKLNNDKLSKDEILILAKNDKPIETIKLLYSNDIIINVDIFCKN